MHLPVEGSQILAVLSHEAVRTLVPSDEYVAVLTECLCPRSVCLQQPSEQFHIFAEWSSDAVTTNKASDENAADVM